MDVNRITGSHPQDWTEVTVDDLKAASEFALSTGPFGSSIGSRFFQQTGVPVIRGSNLSADGQTYLIDDGFVFLSNEKAAEFRRSVVVKGDLVFTCWGTINQVGLISDRAQFPFYIISNKQMKFTPDPRKADSLFLFYYFSGADFQRQIRNYGIGTSVPGFNLGRLCAIRFSIPQLSEQRAIAEVLSDVDELIGALERLIAKKRDLKQATMQQLLTGQTRLPGFSGGWEEKRLGDCLLSRPDYGINAPAVPYSDRLPTYIRITDITDDGRFKPDPRVSVQSQFADRYVLSDGDVVFARTGASVGKAYRYRAEDGPLVFAGFLIRVRPNPEVLFPAYLAFYVTTEPYWNWVRLMSMRSGQPGVNGNEYCQLPVQLPPIEEQTAIATLLSDMDDELAALEARFTKTRALKQAMMSELLTGKTRLPTS